MKSILAVVRCTQGAFDPTGDTNACQYSGAIKWLSVMVESNTDLGDEIDVHVVHVEKKGSQW